MGAPLKAAQRGGADRSGSSTGPEAAAPSADAPRGALPRGTGRGPLLDALRSALRSGLLVGGAFPPASCLTASAGFGAEPHGFQGVGTALNNLIKGNKVRELYTTRLSGVFLS
jgi:hypothetical protein